MESNNNWKLSDVKVTVKFNQQSWLLAIRSPYLSFYEEFGKKIVNGNIQCYAQEFTEVHQAYIKCKLLYFMELQQIKIKDYHLIPQWCKVEEDLRANRPRWTFPFIREWHSHESTYPNYFENIVPGELSLNDLNFYIAQLKSLILAAPR